MFTSTSPFISSSKKAIFAGLISATVAGATLIGAACPALASTRGWIHEGNTWSYQVSKDTYAKGWYYTPSGKWFFFDSNYKMVTGKVTDDNKDYWLDENAGILYNSWIKTNDGSWMRTNDKGILVTGWYQTANGKYWYFNDDYKLATGKVTDKGYDYWLDASQGLVYDSWVQDASGNWLHTDKWGCLVKGWYQTANGKWWYFNSDYKLATGKVSYKGYDYWLDSSQGLVYDGWAKDAQGNWLHTNDKGILVKGWYQTSNGKWFYFNDDYIMKVGELKENGKIYTLDVNQGWVATRAEGETPSQTQSSEEENTQSSESANKPSSSSTGRVLGTDKNHKPYGATRWVVDKPAWEETKWTATTKYMNGHIISVSTTDPNDLVHIEDTKLMQAWREGKFPSIKTEEDARKEFWTTRLAQRGEALDCKYEMEHEFKPGEPGNWTELPLKTEIIKHPEEGHWE